MISVVLSKTLKLADVLIQLTPLGKEFKKLNKNIEIEIQQNRLENVSISLNQKLNHSFDKVLKDNDISLHLINEPTKRR